MEKSRDEMANALDEIQQLKRIVHHFLPGDEEEVDADQELKEMEETMRKRAERKNLNNS